MEVDNSSQALSGASDDAAKVVSLEEQMKTLQDHVEYLLSRNVNAEKETDRLRKELHGRERGFNAIKAQKFDALAQVSVLQSQLHRRDDEVKNLKTDVDVLGNQLAEASRAKNNALLKLDNLASREESFDYRKKMKEQETGLLRGQIHHLEQRVVQQEAELVDATSTSRVVQLESQLQRMTDELAARDQVANRLRGHLKEEQEKIKKLEEKLSQSRENDLRSNLIHGKEMEAQKRVLAFAEEKQKESEAQAEQYLAKMKEIQSELEIKSIPGDAERKALNEIHRLEGLLSERESLAKQLQSQVHSLSNELDTIKKESLDQYVEKLFPSASLVGQNLRGDLTLTQIYQKYVSAMENLSATKLERDTLKIRNDGLTEEVSDLETRLSSVKSSLEIAESKVQQMNTENNRQQLQLEEAKVVVREKTRSAGQHTIDKERLQQQNEDLRKQVVSLLKEVATAKSKGLETYSDDEPLVGFGSIEQMQHKNIELISLVRELQIKTYNAEMALEKMERVADCNEKLEELIDQVKRYQERELVQSDMMKLVIKQRDHFEESAKLTLQRAEEKMAEMEKELQERAKSQTTSSQPAPEAMVLSLRTPSPVVRQPVYQQRSLSPRPGSPGVQRMQRPPQGSPRFAPYPTPPASKQFVDALHGRLRKCQEELDSTSKSFADYRSNTKNNMDMVVNQLEEMRTTLLDAKLENANLRATCQSGKDKLNSLKSIMEGQQKQLESINKMRTLQDSIITKHEKSVVELNKEIIHTYAKLSNCECLLERAEAEKRRMRVSESAAKKECDTLRASMASQNLVYLGCQELKASRERAGAEDSLHLSNQLQAVQADNKELKHQLETSQVHLQDQVHHLQACLNRERAVLEGALAEKAAALADCTRAQDLLSQAQRDVLVLRTNRNPTTCSESQTDAEIDLTDKVAQLEEYLRKATESERTANAEVQDLNGKLASAMDAHAQTQKMLNEIQQKAKMFEEMAETEKALAKQKTELLESDLSVAREQLMVTKEQLGRAERQMENLRSDSMRASKNQAVAGAENFESVQNELATIKEELVRAREMLEREKEQHKLDLQALSYTRKQVVSQEKAQTETKMKIGTLEDELARIKNEMVSAQNVAAVVKGEDSQLMQELRQHNEILLNQLQKGGGGGQSELHQVIKCLRREKDMAQSKSDVFETKAANLELQLRSMESRCSELEELCDQRTAAEARQTLVTIPQAMYDELLQQSETLNALTDSSIMQRETNVALSAELNELMPKLKNALDELESLKSRNNLFQEKIVSEEENVMELNVKIRELTGKITLAEERIVELESQLNSSQSQLSSNTETLRTKLNVQNQELLKKNFEVRKLSSEKENLLKLSATDKENLAKVSVELTKEKAAVAEANTQMQQLKMNLVEAQKEAAKVAELHESLQQAKDALTKKDADVAVITAREIKVRSIAKKYKLQYDQAVAESKDKESSDEKAKQLETTLAETQTQLAEAQTKLMDTEAEMQRLHQSVSETNKQVEEQAAALAKEQATNLDRQTRMKTVISSARNRIQELSDQNSGLKSELAELRNRVNEIQARPEGTPAEGGSETDEVVNQLRKEVAELKAEIEQTKQSSMASMSTPGTSGTTPAVKIRPLTAQARQVKPQVAQSATVIPTTRAAPTARLRPMVNSPRNVAVLAPSPQEVPSTSVTPIRVRTREDSSESALEESAPNVLLVRPNEVHPQPSTSSASVPSTSGTSGGRPPLLKRPRQPETEQQEPQAKQVCATVPSEEVEQVVADEDSSTDAIVEEDQTVESEAADEDAIDEELEQMALQAVEDNDDADEPLAEEPQLEDQPAAEIEEILEEEQQQQVVAEVERIEPAAAPVNFMLPLMQQGFERFEEVGDFGIVPSTPTLYLPQRQSGFGEVVSSPHVPQSRHFTFTTEPAFAAQLAANVAASHDQDEATSGHMVPGTPQSSSPNENQQNERAESSSEESNQQVASSSNNDFVAPVMAQEPPAGSLSVPRGMLSARRNAESSRIARPTPSRPAPIVWNRNDTPERGANRASGLGRTRGRGRARSNPLRRGRL